MVFNLSCFLLFLFLFSSSSVAFLLLSHCPLVLVVAFSLLPWLLLLLLPLLPPSLLVVVAAVVAVLVFFLLQHPNTCFDLSTEFQQLLKLIRWERDQIRGWVKPAWRKFLEPPDVDFNQTSVGIYWQKSAVPKAKENLFLPHDDVVFGGGLGAGGGHGLQSWDGEIKTVNALSRNAKWCWTGFSDGFIFAVGPAS